MKYSVFQICRRKIYVRIGLSLQCSVVLTAYGTGSKFLFDHDLNDIQYINSLVDLAYLELAHPDALSHSLFDSADTRDKRAHLTPSSGKHSLGFALRGVLAFL